MDRSKAHVLSARRIGAGSGVERITVAGHCGRRLEALCRAAGFGDDTTQVLDTFCRVIEPWADQRLGESSGWVSDIADDNTPVELSAAISEGRVQVRVLLEAQADEPTVAAHRRAALALTERLEAEHGADLTRFRRVADIFLPEDMGGPFALWHSIVFDRGRPPALKAYFNPQARGRELAPALVAEGLARLGMRDCWAAVARTSRRGPHLDELKYFALDLSSDEAARVKVYVRHHGATPDDLEHASSAAKDYTPGEVREFVRAMGGDRDRLSPRATFTCSAFHEGAPHASATTAYVPVCAYAEHDAAVERRVADYLEAHGMDPAPYHRLLDGYTERPLESGVGMQSWVAFRRLSGARLTVYLATEAHGVYPPGSVPAATSNPFAFDAAEDVAACFWRYDLSEHPSVRRLRSPVGRDGALAWAIAHAAHEGAPETSVFDDLLVALEPLRPATVAPCVAESGRRFAERIRPLVEAADELERFGARATLEACASQLAAALVDVATHHDLEVAAAGARAVHDAAARQPQSAFELASSVRPEPDAIAAHARGSARAHAAVSSLLDDLYPHLCED